MNVSKELKMAIDTLMNPGCVLPGKVREISVTCGKTGCKCMKKKHAQKHISHQMSYTHEGKTQCLFVRKGEIGIVEEMNNNYKRIRESTLIMGHETAKMIKQYGIEKTKQIVQNVIHQTLRKSIGIKCESRVLREIHVSKERWKNRAKERHKEVEKNRIKIRDLEKSRSCWKKKAVNAQGELKEVKKELRAKEREIKKLKAENEELKKKIKEKEDSDDILLSSSPCGFHFPLQTIIYAIRLVMFGLLSLRGVSYSLSLFNKFFNGGTPCHVVIQDWILRLGLYKLRKLPEKRNDWVYILDYTIEFGVKKCLVVLGIPLEKIRKFGCKIRHCDVEVLGIDIVEKATAKSVSKCLQKISSVTGMPVQIVSDNGSNIKKGITDFIKNVGEHSIFQTYDVTHKVGLILKHYLSNDDRWQLFVKLISETKRKLVHTCMVKLAPPKPKDKARWLNIEEYVKWAEKVIREGMDSLSKQEKEKFIETLAWVKDFEEDMIEWRTILDLINILKTELKENGFSEKTKKNFEANIANLNLHTIRLKNIKNDMLNYIEQQTEEMLGIFLACSDIIESILGKYKIFSGKSPMKEVGKTVLTIPAFTGELTAEDVKEALQTISHKDVQDWIQSNIGESLFSRRKTLSKPKCTKNSVKNISENLQKAVDF